MIFDQISSIVSEIEEARDIQENILLLSNEPDTIEKVIRLSDVITKLEANVVSIQSQYIQTLKEKVDLEKKIKSDPCIQIVE